MAEPDGGVRGIPQTSRALTYICLRVTAMHPLTLGTQIATEWKGWTWWGGEKLSKCSVFSTAFNEGLLSGPACCGAPNSVMTRSLNHPAADIQLCCSKVTWKYMLLRHQPHTQLGEMQANVRVPRRLCRKMGRKWTQIQKQNWRASSHKGKCRGPSQARISKQFYKRDHRHSTQEHFQNKCGMGWNWKA